MTALERVNQLKNQGMPLNEIIRTLQNEKISPKEINDALAQSQIKQAVSREDEEEVDDMQPSMMGGKLSESEREYVPRENTHRPPAPISEENYNNYVPQTPYNQYGDSQEYYPQEPSEGGEEYYPQEGNEDYGYETISNADTTIEIAEQVFTEKMKKFQNQMENLMEFKTLFETKVENIAERLKRIERMFDQVQISIIEKVGTYGKGLEHLKKEVEMVEDSFSKIVGKVKKSHSKK